MHPRVSTPKIVSARCLKCGYSSMFVDIGSGVDCPMCAKKTEICTNCKGAKIVGFKNCVVCNGTGATNVKSKMLIQITE